MFKSFVGVQFADDLGLNLLTVESDSKTLIKKLNSQGLDLSDIGRVVHDIKSFSRRFTSCAFSFIGRRGNHVAHVMASEGRNSSEDRFWVEDAPAKVLRMAVDDRRFIDPP
ncbi:hypothetical protein V6N12_071023 [Hibiscus sabdariffa]|uniref:RNase H type-1 domain-containing protein n=1 Tax=Hibiscus sabdariffa TaxID=183260 RepID=A0ABR2FIT0_9ROSI